MPHCNTTTAHQRPHKPLKRPVRAAHHLDLLRRLWPVLARLRGIDALQAEHDENEIRKQFTVTERLAIAQRIAERLHGRVGNPELRANSGNISPIEQGRTKDIAAAKAGLGSGKTLEAAQKVVEHGATELVEAMDTKKPARWPAFACVLVGDTGIEPVTSTV